MAAEAKHRDAIVGAAIGLFRRRGYSATGMNDIVATSGAPKGSLYHYFPGGKAEIGAAAVTAAGAVTLAALRKLAADADSAEAFLRAYFNAVGHTLEQSGFQIGCPLATVLLENAPQDIRMAEAGRVVFAQWAAVIAETLVRDGVPPDTALRLGSLAVSAFEGALLQARVERSLARWNRGVLAGNNLRRKPRPSLLAWRPETKDKPSPFSPAAHQAKFRIEFSLLEGYPDQTVEYSKGSIVPLYIKDDATALLVNRLAKRRGITKQDAVKLAVQAELERDTQTVPLRERLAALRAAHPLPPATGKVADKAFFDELSGNL